MSNTQALANSFKSELMAGIHALGVTVVRGTTTVDSLKAALYLASATLNNGTTVYSATGEASGAGYSAGGVAITNANAPSLSANTAVWTPSASISFNGVTLTAFDCCLVYNSTQGNKAIGVFTFGSQSVTAGNFSLSMPVNDATHALIQLT